MNKQVNLLSGAEAIANILKKEKIKYIFAYPGTSELVLCNTILETKGLTLINGRGDKESAFMAAGGSLIIPGHSAAILHGARGLTNATGALADAYRNEVSVLYIVGLPSTQSAVFLPPHGEKKLLESIGNFVKYYEEISMGKDTLMTAKLFIKKVSAAVKELRALPYGPVMIGIPQDVSEKHFIPSYLLDSYFQDKQNVLDFNNQEENFRKAVELLQASKSPVIFIDDFAYKNSKLKKKLLLMSKRTKAPIFQVFYGRGPMLFEQIKREKTSSFLGLYDPNNSKHVASMRQADLLLTIEDRNMYPRVVGELPNCPKIALSSNPGMTTKNRYLSKKDVLLYGDVSILLDKISSIVKISANINNNNSSHFSENNPFLKDSPYYFMRSLLPKLIADTFKNVKNPVLIDDSQMFGGLLSQNYDLFPSDLRVFGDHGAFIGGGLGYAAGFARCNPEYTVFCTLGDQSFTNALQGLVVVAQEKIPVIYIVCNNGKSVSLLKQIHSFEKKAFKKGAHPFLHNAPFSYSLLVRSFGLVTFVLRADASANSPFLERKLRDFFHRAIRLREPVLIELQLPSDPNAWSGIWSVKGNE